MTGGGLVYEDVAEGFASWLKGLGLAENTVHTHRSDAFYLLRYGDEEDFWALVQGEDFEEQVPARLRAALEKNSGGNVPGNLGSYLSSLRKLRRYLRREERGPAPERAPKSRRKAVRAACRRRGDIPTPTAAEVMAYQDKWEALDDYREQERALDRLFFELAPGNRDMGDILLKTVALNSFYSTNIYSIYPVAEHILSLDVDSRLAAGDETLVEDIQRVTLNGREKKLYSFASKYCSHHAPGLYPIYDSYVDEVLRYFRDTDGFSDFRTGELKEYRRFKEILTEFQKYYGLEGFTLKEIDKYLWQLGKEKFPKQYRSGGKKRGERQHEVEAEI